MHSFVVTPNLECSVCIADGRQHIVRTHVDENICQHLSTKISANVLTCSAVQVAISMEHDDIHARWHVIHQYLQDMFTSTHMQICRPRNFHLDIDFIGNKVFV